MKTAICLCGGGAKGAYEAGFAKAINELNINFDIVTGTSIGALNGCLLAQKDFNRLIELWSNVKINDVINGDLPQSIEIDDILKESNRVISFFKTYIKEKGADITPLINLIDRYYNEDKLYHSNVEFGLVTVEFPNLKPLLITKNEAKPNIKQYLLASSSCFPAFPICQIDNKQYIDGGYYDNLPIDFALDLGAEKLIIVDLNDDITHPYYLNKPNCTYIHPKINIGTFLTFDRQSMDNKITLGYYDTLKAFNKLNGYKYTFKADDNDKLYQRYYLSILHLEKEMRRHFNIRKEDTINQKLLNRTTLDLLNIKDIFYISMDILLDSINADIYKLYTLKDASLLIFNKYDEALTSNFDILPKDISSAKELLNDSSSFNIISRIVHQELYSEKQIISKSTIFNLFPLEMAVSLLMLVLIEEYY